MSDRAIYKDYFGNTLHVQLGASTLDCSQTSSYPLANPEAAELQGLIAEATTNRFAGGINIEMDSQSYPASQDQIHVTYISKEGEVLAGMLTENLKSEPPKINSIDIPRAMAGSLEPSAHPLGKACTVKTNGGKITK